MFSRNEKSAKLLRTVLSRENLNHYGSLAQRGLSSFFSRKFINYNNITGLVKNSQHIYSGVTKRGSVDIVLEHDGIQYDLCSVSADGAGRRTFIGLLTLAFGVLVRHVHHRAWVLHVALRRFRQKRRVRRRQPAGDGWSGVDRVWRTHQAVRHVLQPGPVDGTRLVRDRVREDAHYSGVWKITIHQLSPMPNRHTPPRKTHGARPSPEPLSSNNPITGIALRVVRVDHFSFTHYTVYGISIVIPPAGTVSGRFYERFDEDNYVFKGRDYFQSKRNVFLKSIFN